MDEMLDIVDDQDRVIDAQMRSTAHELGLQHRGIHVFLFTSSRKMLVQKRSADRAAAPSALDCSVSEHVKAGESYLEAAVRGLREELGVDGIELRPLVRFRMRYGPYDNEISTVFEGTFDGGTIRFDPMEIEEVYYYSLDEIREMIEGGQIGFCGWFLEIFKWYVGEAAELTVLQTF